MPGTSRFRMIFLSVSDPAGWVHGCALRQLWPPQIRWTWPNASGGPWAGSFGRERGLSELHARGDASRGWAEGDLACVLDLDGQSRATSGAAVIMVENLRPSGVRVPEHSSRAKTSEASGASRIARAAHSGIKSGWLPGNVARTFGSMFRCCATRADGVCVSQSERLTSWYSGTLKIARSCRSVLPVFWI